MPDPQVAEPSAVARAGEFVGTVIAAIGSKSLWDRLRNGKNGKNGHVDYEKIAETIARAVMAEKSLEDERHRNAIVDALHDVSDTVRQVNQETTNSIRQALVMYGKDVSEIRSAQERADDRLTGIERSVNELRIEVAKR